MLAVVGADGAGKSTYCKGLGKKVIHALPSGRNGYSTGYLNEIYMGMRKSWVFLKLRLMRDKNVVLDRCYIDSLVYSLYWARKLNKMGIYHISRFFNSLAFQPDIIYQLEPEPTLAKPKRPYTAEEIDELNKLYVSVLFTEGWHQIDYTDYDLGLIRIWVRRGSDGKGI